MKHTKGEWYIDKELTDNGAPIIVSDTCWQERKRPIAKVLFFYGSEDPEVQSNARLIAAAPALLEACELYQERIELFRKMNPDIVIKLGSGLGLKQAEDKGKAALAAAEKE